MDYYITTIVNKCYFKVLNVDSCDSNRYIQNGWNFVKPFVLSLNNSKVGDYGTHLSHGTRDKGCYRYC